jgi:hypothetical protein
MTSQEAKQHIKKAQENPEEYHFEWFFDEDGEEITPEPEHIFQTKEFKALSWKQKLYVRLKVAVWETLMMR